ncbi:MAG: ABC-F family ATP-binding cassette domain-containing protein [Flavipsychrobacter sp.]
MISVSNVSMRYGAKILFDEVSTGFSPGKRYGLTGPNGAGKSTFMKLLSGELEPQKGTVVRPKKIGILSQDQFAFDQYRVIDTVIMGNKRLWAALEERDKLYAKTEMTDADGMRLGELEGIVGEEDGYTAETDAAVLLQGLDIPDELHERKMAELPGGQKVRVLLAQALFGHPLALLLDEPTNHLDLPSIEWLERYLQGYPGSVVIVSHDRYFLDRMVTKIVEVWQRDLHQYSGNYTFYQKEKAERMDLQQRAYENQQEYIRQQERFIERFRAKATKAAQAQSAIKRLDKLDVIEAPDTSVPVMNINFDVGIQPGKIITELRHITKHFGDLSILKDANAEILRGDKIALIGANGRGKSTLLRIIAGKESFEGERKEGHNVEESFYAQHQLEALNVENDLLDEMKQCGSGKTELELRQLLGCFLFSGDDVFKKIKVLSGGEKARVALAKVIATKGNFLMLDEPTNHLDMQSVEMLIDALNKYDGTIILVSHDRYFISRLANKIWNIEDGKVKEFVGSYDEWVVYQQDRAKREQAAAQPKPAPVEKKEEKKIEKPKINDQELRTLRNEHQKQQKLFQKLEAELGKLQEEKTKLEAQLADPEFYNNKDKFVKLDEEYRKLSAKFDDTSKAYDSAFEKMLEMEEKLG